MKYVLIAYFHKGSAMQYPLHDSIEEAESAARLTLQELEGLIYVAIWSCLPNPLTGAPILLAPIKTVKE